MIWYLLICTQVYGGGQCLPLQLMLSQEMCLFARKQYLENSDITAAKCVGLRK